MATTITSELPELKCILREQVRRLIQVLWIRPQEAVVVPEPTFLVPGH